MSRSPVSTATAGPVERSLWAVPEVTVAFLSFALHFVWEFLQVPTYAGMAELNHWEGVKVCTSATVGDVGFALTAFWATSAASRSRQWIAAPRVWQTALFVAVGIPADDDGAFTLAGHDGLAEGLTG